MEQLTTIQKGEAIARLIASNPEATSEEAVLVLVLHKYYNNQIPAEWVETESDEPVSEEHEEFIDRVHEWELAWGLYLQVLKGNLKASEDGNHFQITERGIALAEDLIANDPESKEIYKRIKERAIDPSNFDFDKLLSEPPEDDNV